MDSTIETKAVATVVFLLGGFIAADGRADPLTEKSVAQALFDEGRAAMTANHVAEACSKFGESYKLDPSAGTLLNLGLCHEKEGRTASAYTELNESVSRAIRDQRPEREKLAREHLAALTPRLSRLTVTLAARAVDGIVVSLDATLLPKGAWGIAMPVDPGDHVVEATAPGKRTWHGSVTVGAEHDVESVEVPALVDDTSAVPVAPAVQPPPPAVPTPRREASPTDGSTQRMIGWGLVGVGAAGAVVGSLFGSLAISKWNSATGACPNAICASAADRAAHDGAGTLADVSTVAFVVGALALAGGALTLFTAPRPAERPAAVRLGPMVGPAVAGLSVGGAL